jgi:hypothetical protein
MRKVLLVLSLLLASAGAVSAQTAPPVPYQLPVAVRILRDGDPVSETLPVRFSIYDRATSGRELWNEEATQLAVRGGFVSHTLGLVQNNPLPANLFDGSVVYLQLVVNSVLMDTRIPIRSVPYALRAGSAASADSATVATRANLAESLGLPTTPAADRVTVTAQGRVGLGVAAPTARLDVNGGINASGAVAAGGPLSTTGAFTAASATVNGALAARSITVTDSVVATPTFGNGVRITEFSTSSSTFVAVPNLSAQLTTHGKPVLVSVTTNFNARVAPSGATDVWAVATLYRDGVDLAAQAGTGYDLQIAGHFVGVNTPFSFTFVDTGAPAGAHTYQLMVRSGNGGTFDLGEGNQLQQLAAVELN